MRDELKTKGQLVLDILVTAGREYAVDRVSRMAAAVSYRAIFALAPLLILAVAVFGFVVGDSAGARQEILDAVERFAGVQASDAVATLVDSAVQTGSTAALLGLVLLLWTSTSLFQELQQDLNDIFDVPYEHTSGAVAFLKKRGLGFLWTLGLGLVLIAVWLVNLSWRFLERLFPQELAGVHSLIGWLAPLVSVIVLPVVFALLFQTMTAVRVQWRAIWWGALFTSVVFLLAAYGTGLYFTWGADPSASRVAASFFVILLLAFVLSAVFLFGAVVTKVYNDYLENGEVG